MNIFARVLLCGVLLLNALFARAEDIDLFASGLASGSAASALPSVLFVLDNTSNWSRQSQQWPDGTQGQSEVRAIRATLERLLDQGKDINVGLLEFTTDGNANQDGGYVRFDLQRLGDNASSIFAILDTIDANIGSPEEKRNSNSAYGNLASDIYAYLAGESQSFLGEGTPASLPDEDAYANPYVVFESPLTQSDICSDTYVILVSNPDSNGPEVDTGQNSDRLRALYAELGEEPSAALAGEIGIGIPMPEYEEIRNNSEGPEVVGYSALGYRRVSQCNNAVNGNTQQSADIQAACPLGGDCYCTSQFQRCQGNLKCYQVERPATSSEQESYGTTGQEIDGIGYNLDDWAKFLHELGVPLQVDGVDGEPDSVIRVPVTTYTVDVFNATPSEEHSSLMDSAAEQGGGYRQAATNQAEIERALGRIFGDIIDINTAFAAVTLPLSATNRAQAENKVFVGMFRPASQRKPRWLGNLKQYQLAEFDGQIELADVNRDRAINPQTGFAQSCATSFWTEDTSLVTKAPGVEGPYFADLGLEPSPVSECLSEFRDGRSVLSDSPDGPFVEKGGAAQQIRMRATGQSDAAGQGRTSTRVVLTQSGSGLLPISASAAGSPELLAYLLGEDSGLKGGDLKVPDGSGAAYVDNPLLGDEEQEPFQGLRPTIHGDVVHSRPLTITYGPIDPDDQSKGSDFRIFYGANDGLFRSLDPDSGQEDWALIAPEHVDGIQRLYANTPSVDYFGLDASISTEIGAEPKRYFFDGSIGSYTRYNEDDELVTAWIYPTMRRGGSSIYALDVSPTGTAGEPPALPRFKWKIGLEQLPEMGQSWSTPVAAQVKGYIDSGAAADSDPVVLVFGGGWDDCLDVDQAAPLAGCSLGKKLYVLDADTGALLRSFATDAPVVGDVSAVDIDLDGYVDFIYAADAAGNLYRLNFSTLDSLTDPYAETLQKNEWALTKIASSSLSNVRFLNKPVVAAIGNKVFVTIGSGDRERPLKQNYPYAESVQNRFYAFIDEPYGDATPVADLDAVATALERGMLNLATGLGEGERLLENYRGWFMDLPDRGEQVVNPAAIGASTVFFNTFQPEGGTKGICNDLGQSKFYPVNLFRPEFTEGEESGQGVPIPPIIVEVKLDSAPPPCIGECGPGTLPPKTVRVCIGCKGFDPLKVGADVDAPVGEAYTAEDIDRF